MNRSIFVLITTVCIAIVTSVAFAQENARNGGTVRGAVFDTTRQQNPLEGVEVQIVDTTNNRVITTVKTDVTGQYRFDNVPAGRYLINVSKKGYVDRVGKAVTVVENGDHFVLIKMLKQNDTDKPFIERFFKYIAESIGERYKLEKPSAEALYQSLFEIFTVLEPENLEVIIQKGSLEAMAVLLSEPDSKAVFAKHLTETQLHDYIEFIENRQRQARQTTARFLTAFLDETLSLNSKQREDVLKLLLDTIIAHSLELPIAYMFSGPNLQQDVVDLLHDELEVSLQTILTPTQAKIWNGLIKLKNAEADLVASELIDALLTTHTEQQLGTLREQENRRLRVAIKGIMQQAIEKQPDNIEGKINYIDALDELTDMFITQNLPRQQAIEQLKLLKKELADEIAIGKRWRGLELHNLTSHPLYQWTIKDVLSEEAYRQYTERQTERQGFQTRASQELFVTFIDMLLLLKETHRKQLETTAVKVPLLSLNADGLHMMVTEILLMDPEFVNVLRLYLSLEQGGIE